MNELIHNLLTDMPLPYFLAMYGACSLIAILAGSFWIWLCDGTRDEDLSDELALLKDPYEIAYLSGHARRVTLLGIFDLVERGYLERLSSHRRLLLVRVKYLRRCCPQPSLDELTPIQCAIWKWFERPRSEREVFDRQTGLLKVLEPPCQGLIEPLQKQRLLETPLRWTMRRLVGWTLAVGIVGVGFYKLITSIIAGHPETFCLLLMITVGLAFTAMICRPQRLSDLGQRVLDRLLAQYGERPFNNDRLLTMALFGSVESPEAARPNGDISNQKPLVTNAG